MLSIPLVSRVGSTVSYIAITDFWFCVTVQPLVIMFQWAAIKFDIKHFVLAFSHWRVANNRPMRQDCTLVSPYTSASFTSSKKPHIFMLTSQSYWQLIPVLYFNPDSTGVMQQLWSITAACSSFILNVSTTSLHCQNVCLVCFCLSFMKGRPICSDTCGCNSILSDFAGWVSGKR